MKSVNAYLSDDGKTYDTPTSAIQADLIFWFKGKADTLALAMSLDVDQAGVLVHNAEEAIRILTQATERKIK
jgi:hypothetical protein